MWLKKLLYSLEIKVQLRCSSLVYALRAYIHGARSRLAAPLFPRSIFVISVFAFGMYANAKTLFTKDVSTHVVQIAQQWRPTCDARYYDKCINVSINGNNIIEILGTISAQPSTVHKLEQLYQMMLRHMDESYLSNMKGSKAVLMSGCDMPSEWLDDPWEQSHPGWLKNEIDHGYRGYTGNMHVLLDEDMICHKGVRARFPPYGNDTAIRRLDQAAHEFGHLVDMRNPSKNITGRLKEIYQENHLYPCDNSDNAGCIDFSSEHIAWLTQKYFSQSTDGKTGITATVNDIHPKVREFLETIYGEVPALYELDLCNK